MRMKIRDIISDKYKLRIPPTVYYDLLADVVEAEKEQEPNIGHWVYKTVRGENVPCCSVCGLDNGTHYEYNFCPECGAKMVECEVKE